MHMLARRWLVPATLVILLLPACGSDDAYPTSTAVVTGAEDDTATEQFQAVDEAYDLYNTGDVEAWVEVRDSGSQWPSDEDRTEGMEKLRQQVQANYDAGSRYVETECVSHGFDDWEGVADGALATGYYFTCEAVLTSDFEDSDATKVSESFNWVVNEGVVVAVNSNR